MTDYAEPLVLAQKALKRFEEHARNAACGFDGAAHKASVELSKALTEMQRLAEWLYVMQSPCPLTDALAQAIAAKADAAMGFGLKP